MRSEESGEYRLERGEQRACMDCDMVANCVSCKPLCVSLRAWRVGGDECQRVARHVVAIYLRGERKGISGASRRSVRRDLQ